MTDELKIPRERIVESESPDFLFDFEGKQIGAEIVEYHKSRKETEARKAYQKVIDNYKGEKGTFIFYLYPKILNFTKSDTLTIEYTMEHPKLLTGITLNEFDLDQFEANNPTTGTYTFNYANSSWILMVTVTESSDPEKDL